MDEMEFSYGKLYRNKVPEENLLSWNADGADLLVI